MSLLEGLFDLLEDVNVSENCDLSEGFVMEPVTKHYKILQEKSQVCFVDFIDKESELSEDAKIAQDNPSQYKVILTEIKDEEKTKIYIKKLTDLGFVDVDIEQN